MPHRRPSHSAPQRLSPRRAADGVGMRGAAGPGLSGAEVRGGGAPRRPLAAAQWRAGRLAAAVANVLTPASALALALLLVLGLAPAPARAELPETIAAVKPALVIVGSYNATASPRFSLRGAGFAVGNGSLVLTNAHVLEAALAGADPGSLAVQVRNPRGELQMRGAVRLATDAVHDLALLRIDGAPLPALRLGDSATVREGQAIAFIGFPIGGALGFSPVTHRGIVASITPIVLPSPSARQLNPSSIQRVRDGVFDIFQLDATAYPGNSGGPVFDPLTGEVLGVLNMAFVKSAKESALSQPSGISYAIPSRFIAALLQSSPP